MPTPLPTGWETDILNSIGAPVTPQNIQDLDVWQKMEGGSTLNSASYNPLDTTQRGPGSSSMNSVGVQAYPDWSTGLAATSQTLEYGYYKSIVADLLSGNTPYAQFAADVNASPWGSHLPNAAPSGTSSPGGGSPGFGLHSIGDAASAVGNAVNPANLIVDAIKGLITNGYVMRGTLMLFGIIVVFIGLSQVTKADGAGGTLAAGAQDLQVTVRQAGKRRSSTRAKPKTEAAAEDAGEAAA